jgi:hypothetical protein
MACGANILVIEIGSLSPSTYSNVYFSTRPFLATFQQPRSSLFRRSVILALLFFSRSFLDIAGKANILSLGALTECGSADVLLSTRYRVIVIDPLPY